MKILSAIVIALAAVVSTGCASNQAPLAVAAPNAGRARVPMYFHLPTKDGKSVTVDAICSANADRLTLRNKVMEYLKTQLIAQTVTFTETELSDSKMAEVIAVAKTATLKRCQELNIAEVELTITRVRITSM